MKKKYVILLCLLGVIAVGITTFFLFFNKSPLQQAKSDLRNGTYADSYKYIDGTGKAYDLSGNGELFAKKVTYKIENIVLKDNNNGTATVKVSAPNMEVLLKQCVENADINKSDSYDVQLEKVKSELGKLLKSNCEMTEATLTMDIKKTNAGWKLIKNNDWEKAISANLKELFSQNFENAMKGAK